jgi:hypothetical protein
LIKNKQNIELVIRIDLWFRESNQIYAFQLLHRPLLVNVPQYLWNSRTSRRIAVNAAHLSKPLDKLLKGAKKLLLLPGNPSPVTFGESKADLVSLFDDLFGSL